MKMRFLVPALMLIGLIPTVRADEPLAPPERVATCSTSGSVCADSDPGSNRTTISRKDGSGAPWAVDGWHRWLFPSNDGAALVVAYEGLNLVPEDSTLQLEVLRFYNRGKLVRTVRLADLYSSKSLLKRTVSHFAWVNAITANTEDELVVELACGHKVTYSMATGQVRR